LGDQIGRIFANWAAVYFVKLLVNYKKSHIVELLCSTLKVKH
jgi:hypothetical protein